jgi:hypothetical protein
MNAIMALLTAASLLAHAGLGCCIHHAHGPSAACLGGPSVAMNCHERETGHAHSSHNDHEHSGRDEQVPKSPHRSCDEGFCSAIASTPSGNLLKPTQAAFGMIPPVDLCLAGGSRTLQADYRWLQHDLGPPLRSHLCNLVLLI